MSQQGRNLKLAENVIAVPLVVGETFKVRLKGTETWLEIQLDDVREDRAGIVVSIGKPFEFAKEAE